MAPRFTPGDRSSVLCWRPKRTEPVETGRAASVSGHIWAALSRVNAFLQFYFALAAKPPKPLVSYGYRRLIGKGRVSGFAPGLPGQARLSRHDRPPRLGAPARSTSAGPARASPAVPAPD